MKVDLAKSMFWPVILVPAILVLLTACARPIPAPLVYGTKTTDKEQPVNKAVAAPLAAGNYTVAADETLYAISRRSGVALRDLITTNRLKPPYRLLQGQRLEIPRLRYHQVAEGETLYSISRQYRVSLYALAKGNQVPAPYNIQPGQRLRLPAGDGAAATAPRKTPLQAALAKKSASAPAPGHKPKVRRPVTTRPPARASSRFAWPVKGRVISRFGVKANGLHNDGINIAVKKGVAVRAADNGVVVYAGNELRGFGNLLLLRHRGGWLTAYGHNQTLTVKVGDVVRRGQKIARAGSTGNITRPQLHFEIRKGRKAVNPARHLAARRA